jgi:hypothetical protein
MHERFNKYQNQTTLVDGIAFDSKREARRYAELRLLEKGGVISGLETQKRYEIVPKSAYGRALYYIADFVYTENGKSVIEDVKGVKTQIYVLKKRLIAEQYGIKIQEI